jgi:hypothetical protein
MNTLIPFLLIFMSSFTSHQTDIVNRTSKCSAVDELFLLKCPILTVLICRVCAEYYILLRDFMWDSQWRNSIGVGVSTRVFSSLLLIMKPTPALLLLCHLPLQRAALLARERISTSFVLKLGAFFLTQVFAGYRIRKCFLLLLFCHLFPHPYTCIFSKVA